MAVSSTNVKVGDGSTSVLGHYGVPNASVTIANHRYFEDLAFKPHFSNTPTADQISFSDFAGARGAMNHALGNISFVTSEPRYDGSYMGQSSVSYQAQDPSSNPRGDRISILLYDTNDASPGAVAVNSYFMTYTSGAATLNIDWDIQTLPPGGSAVVIVRSYKYGYINGPWINNGIYQGGNAITSLPCTMDVTYPHTVINVGVYGPGSSTYLDGPGSILLYKARLR